MSRMEVPLGERQLKTALRIYNKITVEDNDFGWFGDPTWEFSKYRRDDYFSLQIRFESWRMKREEFEAFTEFIESLDPVYDLDWYLSHDSPIVFTVKIAAEEALNGDSGSR